MGLLALPAHGQCQLSKHTAPDGAPGDRLGQAVAVYGDWMFVAARRDQPGGSVYVYERSGSGWRVIDKLRPSDLTGSDDFGRSVAISGDVAVVGAPSHGIPDTGAGAVYVYAFNGNRWIEIQKLTASDAEFGDNLGGDVDIDNLTIIAGAIGDDIGDTRIGSAYIFSYDSNSGQFEQEDKIVPADGADLDNFGWSVSISDDLAAIGAYRADGSGTDRGKAYVYESDGAGTWNLNEKFQGTEDFCQFGYDVTIDQSTLAVGARLHDRAGQDAGLVVVYDYDEGNGWTETTSLEPSGNGTEDGEFGSSVSINDDVLAIGAHNDNEAAMIAGAAYIYQLEDGEWSESFKLIAPDAAADDYFGSDVCVSGNRLVVGAWGDDPKGQDSGSAYAYSLFDFQLDGAFPGRAGEVNTLIATCAAPGHRIYFAYGLSEGSTPVGPCPGLTLDIQSPVLLAFPKADASGDARISGMVPSGLSGVTLFFQAVDIEDCTVTNLVEHTF